MSELIQKSIGLPKSNILKKMKSKRIPLSFDLEITARCNNNCRHCYINLPATSKDAEDKEISFEDVKRITDEAVSLGTLWCLITGGEPLLREDFFDIYLYLKKRGILVSIFTNATLITEKHIKIFKKYPARNIEVSVYGVTKKTYERVTRTPGSFNAFMQGLNLLLGNGIKVRFKAMALRSNVHELKQISNFCRERTKDYFRFDPFLHLRFDNNQTRNQEIKSERLSPEEIISLEQSDKERLKVLEKECDKLIIPAFPSTNRNHLFLCNIGQNNFTIGYNRFFRLCPSLWHDACVYDLHKGTLINAWEKFVPHVKNMRSNKKEFLKKCRRCSLINLCLWCPAYAYLETGALDTPVDYFCKVAHARAEMLKKS